MLVNASRLGRLFIVLLGACVIAATGASVASAHARKHTPRHTRVHRSKRAKAARAKRHIVRRTRRGPAPVRIVTPTKVSLPTATAPAPASTTKAATSAAPVLTPTATVSTPTTATSTTPTSTSTTSTSTPIANSFGAGMFGIAAGGTLQNEDSATLTRDLTMDSASGARWLRVDINWAQIQQAGRTSYNWSAIDAVVTGAHARGMSVLGTIVYSPSWEAATPTTAPNPADYAAFAAKAAAHYGPLGVDAFEIWNEPNTSASWQNPSPAAYTQVLKAAYPAIKAADPSAAVVTAGLSPSPTDGTNYSPVDFLSGIYAAGGQGSFDAVGAHPYCSPDYPGDTDSWSAWYQMYGTSTSMRSVMIAHGDGSKKIWATEYGAPTNGPAGVGIVSQAVQAAMVTRAYQVWSTYSWGGPLFLYQGRDQGTDTSTDQNFYGFINHDFSPKPAYLAYQALTAAI